MGRVLDKRISPGLAFHWAGLVEKIVELSYFSIAREQLHEGVSDNDAGGRREGGICSVHWVKEARRASPVKDRARTRPL